MATRASTARVYQWTFTIQVRTPTGWTLPAGAVNEVKYLVAQLEQAPTTNQLHWQGFLIAKKQLRIGQVKKLLNAEGAHCEPARASPQQNRDYCTKEETRYKSPVRGGHNYW